LTNVSWLVTRKYRGDMYPREMSVEKMKAAAESGDPKAAFRLAWCYYLGRGLARDKMEACKWYTRAASQGLREAAEIRGILEIEAQRNSELKILREPIPSSHKRSTVWLLLIAVILTIIGSISVVFHVLNGQVDVERLDAASDKKAIQVDAINHSRGNSEKPASLAQEERRSQDPAKASVVGHSVDGAPTKHGDTASAAGAVEQSQQPRLLVDRRVFPGPRADFNDWAKFARRWLEDGNDPHSPSRPSGATGQERRQE
jgi:hypothetical protein